MESYRGKISLEETIWVGTHVEPRILELLPAAYFQKKAVFKGEIPQELKMVLQEMKEGQVRREFYGIDAAQYSHWFHLLPKRKTSHKIFRFDHVDILKLMDMSEILNCTETEVIKRGLDILYKTLVTKKKYA